MIPNFAARILPFEDFVMTSGAPLPVDTVTLSAILDFAYQQYGSEGGKYITIDMQQKADFTAADVNRAKAKKECLRNWDTNHQ